jgi:large subunit ribosomal protein L21
MPGEQMKYAIVESGGKQYKAVEGETIDVDRLPVDVGSKVDLKQVLLTVDGEEVSIGTPTVAGIQVSTTVVNHYKGPKVVVFKYSPKKRIRVRSGHRQQYTRLNVEVIGKPGESRKAAKVEKPEPAVEKPAAQTAKKETVATATKKTAAPKKASAAKASKPTIKKTTTAKSPAKASPKKTTQAKAPAKPADKKKTTTKAPAKKSSTTKPKKTTR